MMRQSLKFETTWLIFFVCHLQAAALVFSYHFRFNLGDLNLIFRDIFFGGFLQKPLIWYFVVRLVRLIFIVVGVNSVLEKFAESLLLLGVVIALVVVDEGIIQGLKMMFQMAAIKSCCLMFSLLPRTSLICSRNCTLLFKSSSSRDFRKGIGIVLSVSLFLRLKKSFWTNSSGLHWSVYFISRTLASPPFKLAKKHD